MHWFLQDFTYFARDLPRRQNHLGVKEQSVANAGIDRRPDAHLSDVPS
jgi:hypothetical protein